ncbi:methionine ABC transporter substrate-binding lipoprotein MetQ [Marinomonas algarum]|uniref:Lipoprotein n=1 Tax=Marinomonas algarum TaxID=2883105 RepID=A0A9X1IN28_9GAMM|nr:methionine ABC transporter substrate-binding lipoprotein MetQ [Marinomonas algarum]MCB5162270.1 methionine ABC transporter substrate-binding lipoprotein MetQ [Marinomonas algarum]
MRVNLKGLFAVTGLAVSLLLAACGEKEADMNKITVGVIAGSEAQVAEAAAKVAKDTYNLDVELVIFSDYVTPNAALEEGSIDANAFQHKPYLDQQMQDRGYDFAIAGNSFVYPIAAYSNSIQSTNELKDGDKIAVPNDPTNLARSLILLEQQGLITLKEGVGLKATVLDIVDSPKNLDIVELEAAQLVRSMDDVALAIINTTYASNINLSPEKDGVFVEDKNSPYVNLIVARKDNVQAENVKKFVQAYQTEAVYQAAMTEFKDGVVKGW